MREVKLKLILLGFLLLAGPATGFAQQQTILVTGRAIDERGVPISDAIVTLYYPPCRDCIDHILPVSFTHPDGVFFIDHKSSSLRGLKLFIQERVPKGFWSPFHAPPFEKLSHLPAFQGIPISPRKGSEREDLGDVLVRIRYSKVTLDLPKVLGEQYKPSQEASRLLNVTLQDSQGNVIYEGPLPEVAFDPTFSFINLALTKGKWIVNISPAGQPQMIRPRRLVVGVTTAGVDQYLDP